MGWKDFFHQDNKEKNEQSIGSTHSPDATHRPGRSPLLLGFNLAAGATVLLPLVMWMIARLVRDGDAQAAKEDGHGAALFFVYIWSLLVFACIVWHGNQVMERDSKELLKVFLASLVFFSNLAFLLSVLTGRLGVQREGKEAEESGWLGQFPAAMVLTFVFWTVFGLVWIVIVYRKIWTPMNESSSNEYRRQDDSPAV